MKILQFNAYNYGSTGDIMLSLHDYFLKEGHDSLFFYTFNSNETIFKKIKKKFIGLISRLTGNYGLIAKSNTKKFIKYINKNNPDVLLFHNIHDNSLDFNVLFNFLISCRSKIFFVLHDCWNFTGYCFHFSSINCFKWQKHCEKCPQCKKISWFFDKSSKMFEIKKKCYNLRNCSFLCPSIWIKEQSENSIFNKKAYFVGNPIDFSVFKIEKRCVTIDVLGVAFDWSLDKGVSDFNFLARNLPEKFSITVVCPNKKHKLLFDKRITVINKMLTKNELAELYNSTSVYLNASKAESFGLTTVEALACGTPVIAYNSTATKELINDQNGVLIDNYDVIKLLEETIKVLETKSFSRESCRESVKRFDRNEVFKKYLDVLKNENINS